MQDGDVMRALPSDAETEPPPAYEPVKYTGDIQMVYDPAPDDKVKTIMFWTPFYKRPFTKIVPANPFASCRYQGCQLTDDRSRFNQSTAVLIHMWDLKSLDDLPKYRFPWQHWIYLNEEPPTQLKISGQDGIYNATMTYRTDSDIYDPYGGIEKWQPWELSKARYKRGKNYAAGKSRLAAWFVSDCDDRSMRLSYTRSLQKFIKVDIYGECGPLKCGKQKRDIECFKMVEQKYKFYFAFENSICAEYVSEKVFTIMHYDVIPVVLGPFNYSRVLPKNSYIDARNFSSPWNLAKFLIRIDSDDQLYNSYFKWKAEYYPVQRRHRYCRLCEYAHVHANKRQVKERVDDWWNDCQSVNDFYEGVADVDDLIQT